MTYDICFIFAYIHCISSISMINCLPCCRFACGSYGSFGAVWQPEDRHLWNATCVTTCLGILEYIENPEISKKLFISCSSWRWSVSWRNSSVIGVVRPKKHLSISWVDELVINMNPLWEFAVAKYKTESWACTQNKGWCSSWQLPDSTYLPPKKTAHIWRRFRFWSCWWWDLQAKCGVWGGNLQIWHEKLPPETYDACLRRWFRGSSSNHQ